MTKSVLMSCSPDELTRILNGEQTVLLRKKVPKDFKGWVYLYCTKGGGNLGLDYVSWDEGSGFFYGVENHIDDFSELNGELLNGKVVARFWMGEVEVFDSRLGNPRIYSKACIDDREVLDMFEHKMAYAIHIKKLDVFEEPKELNDFVKWGFYDNADNVKPCLNGKECKHLYYDDSENTQACEIDFSGDECLYRFVDKAPKTFVYVYEEVK